MDRRTYEPFFLQPENPWQRRYEALRAIFVEEDTALQAAQRFGVSHGTVRNWVSEFCAEVDQGQPTPFFYRRHGEVPAVALQTPRTMTPPNRRTSQPSL